MQRETYLIKTLGVLLALSGATHLLLNLFALTAPLFIPHVRMADIMHSLANIFGPIAIREDMNVPMLCVKVTVSALFLTGGMGIFNYREWARRLLFFLLGLRLIAGSVICVFFATFYTHMALIAIEFILLTYYFTRPQVRAHFA